MTPAAPDAHAIAAALPGPVLVLAPARPHLVVAASDAYVRASGLARAEIVGRPLGQVLADRPDDPRAAALSELLASIGRAVGTRAPDTAPPALFDLRPTARRPAEAPRWWRATHSPVLDAGGGVAWVLHLLEDTTEARRLAEERDLFVALVENSSDFIGIADPSGTPVYVNPAGRRMVGMAADLDVRETRIPEYYPPDQRDFAHDVILQGMLRDGHWAGETAFRDWRTDERIPVSDEHFLIRRGGDGPILGMGTITRDLREKRQAERALRDSEALAEDLAARAALASENARLYEEARRAVHARDEVLAVVAHDLRNPLGAVRLAAHVLGRLAPADADVMRRNIDTIQRSLARADRLIDDLLTVTRIEGGQLVVDARPLSVHDLLQEVAAQQRLLAEAQGIELRVEVGEDPLVVAGDHDRLLQVAENLVSNALRFTPAGGRVTLGAAPVDGGVVVRVEDTGAGIEAEDLPHVFDRFWKARRTERAGAGLGLPIAKGIVEAHGGRIWAESAPGRGSTFRFRLPRREG